MFKSFYFVLLILFFDTSAWSQSDSLLSDDEEILTPQAYLENYSDNESDLNNATQDLLEKEFFETRDISTEELFEEIRDGLLDADATTEDQGDLMKGFESIVVDPIEGLGVDPNERIEIDAEVNFTGTVDLAEEGFQERVSGSVTLEEEPSDYRRGLEASSYDSRVELWELSPLIRWQQRIIANSRSVGVIVHRDRLSELTDSLYALEYTYTLGDQLDLCHDEQYRNQVSIGSGTAFLIDSSKLITAAHVFESPLDEYVVIFRYELINRAEAIAPVISKKNVYSIEEIIYENTDLDVATIRLDRAAPYKPLKVERNTPIKYGQGVYMIGHPLGLPKKVALNASIIEDRPSDHFFTTLDAYQGNSGSPVFSLATNRVIGILVSGQKDFEWTGDCNKSTNCRVPYCPGEKVIRIESFLSE